MKKTVEPPDPLPPSDPSTWNPHGGGRARITVDTPATFKAFADKRPGETWRPATFVERVVDGFDGRDAITVVVAGAVAMLVARFGVRADSQDFADGVRCGVFAVYGGYFWHQLFKALRGFSYVLDKSDS